MILKLLPILSNFDHELISLVLNLILVSTYKIDVLLNPGDWDCQQFGLNVVLDHLICLVVLPLLECDWGLLEKLFALLLQIILCQTKSGETFESIRWIWNFVNSCLFHGINICHLASAIVCKFPCSLDEHRSLMILSLSFIDSLEESLGLIT